MRPYRVRLVRICYRVAVGAAVGDIVFVSQLALPLPPSRRSRRRYYRHRIAVDATSATITSQALLPLSSSHHSRFCCILGRRE